MLNIFLGAIALVAFLNVVIPKLTTSRKPIERVLYLREITSSPQSMVTLPGHHHKNPFVAEFIVLFEYLANVVDYGVMKFVGEDVGILSKQEQKHALLHLAAIKQRKADGEHALRWKWFTAITEFLVLRCGKTFGSALVLHAEATSWAWMFLPVYLPWLKEGLPNLFVFHGMEEVEHGALTIQSLKNRTNPVLLLLTAPGAVILIFVVLLCPPISVLIFQPKLLFSLKTYFDLVIFYLVFGISFVAAIFAEVVYGILPFRESEFLHNFIYNFLQKEIKERGIKFNVVDQETYVLK